MASKPHILLIQIRKDPTALLSEKEGFVRLSGLTHLHFDTLDVYREPNFHPTIISQYDAIIIGGMSDDPDDAIELDVTQFPFIPALKDLIQHAIQYQIPSLLSCGGFMIASLALGGTVSKDPLREELGVYPITLTAEAQNDPLFQYIPATFSAVSGHKKSTVSLPPDCVLLASSERCPIHAFKISDAPFYAFQFHPEISCDMLEARVGNYKDKYFDSEQAYQEFIRLLEDTSDANKIIAEFVKMIGLQTHISRNHLA